MASAVGFLSRTRVNDNSVPLKWIESPWHEPTVCPPLVNVPVIFQSLPSREMVHVSTGFLLSLACHVPMKAAASSFGAGVEVCAGRVLPRVVPLAARPLADGLLSAGGASACAGAGTVMAGAA